MLLLVGNWNISLFGGVFFPSGDSFCSGKPGKQAGWEQKKEGKASGVKRLGEAGAQKGIRSGIHDGTGGIEAIEGSIRKKQ